MRQCSRMTVCLVLVSAFSSPVWPDAKPSVTVFPVMATPDRFPDDFAQRVGRVIATFLEQAGLENLELADQAFIPPDTEEIQEIAHAFGKYVGEHPVPTDYAVFVQLIGTRATGVQGIRTVVVDKSGQVQLAESAGDAEFDKAPIRPQDPMTSCAFVSRRLQQFWQLEDARLIDAPAGKMAQFWQRDAGIPDQDELDTIAQRLDSLKAKLKTVTFTVYPVCVGGQSDKSSAAGLVDVLNANGIATSQATDKDPALQVAGHSNEQKVLWDTARAFRAFLQTNPPTTDYAMYADYGLFGTKVRYVHVVLCDQAGDWVLLDSAELAPRGLSTDRSPIGR